MRTLAALLLMGSLVGGTACYVAPYAAQREVVRDAVMVDGTRVQLSQRPDGDLTVVQPPELRGMRVVVDPDNRRADVLVVRPMEGQGQWRARRDADDHYRGSGGY